MSETPLGACPEQNQQVWKPAKCPALWMLVFQDVSGWYYQHPDTSSECPPDGAFVGTWFEGIRFYKNSLMSVKG